MTDKQTILLVDDEKNVLKSLRRLFIDTEYQILTAESGEEGLQVLNNNQVQLVISDYRMPGMNGVEFLQSVKSKYPETIRIILSGYADVVAVVEAINDGQIYKFLAKPWNEQELLTAIMRSFEQYNLQKENVKLTRELQNRNTELENLAKSLEEKVMQRTQALELKNKALRIAQNILNLLPIGVIGVDSEQIVVYMNEYLCKSIKISYLALGNPLPDHLDDKLCNSLIKALTTQQNIRVALDNDSQYEMLCTPLINGSGVIGTFIPRSNCNTANDIIVMANSPGE